LDVVYALILNDSEGPREQARARIDAALERPADPEEAQRYDLEQAELAWRERYLQETGAEQAAINDAAFAGQTYGSVG
jgi:hypothetical protein